MEIPVVAGILGLGYYLIIKMIKLKMIKNQKIFMNQRDH